MHIYIHLSSKLSITPEEVDQIPSGRKDARGPQSSIPAISKVTSGRPLFSLQRFNVSFLSVHFGLVRSVQVLLATYASTIM